MSVKSEHSHSHYESGGTRFIRNFLAFFLFGAIVLLSLTSCTGLVFLNSESVLTIFTNEDYITSLEKDVVLYAHDMCDEASIPYDSVDSELTYEAISDIAISYARGNICADAMFTSTSYQTRIDDLNESLNASTEMMLEDYNLLDESVKKEDIQRFSLKITDYIKEKTEFVFIDYVKTAINISKAVSLAAGIGLLVISVVLALIVISAGDRKYRGIRAISYSFIASSMFQIAVILAFEILKKFKTLVFYPTYLCDSVMSFILKCEVTVGVSAVVSFLLALVAMAFVWRAKRDGK